MKAPRQQRSRCPHGSVRTVSSYDQGTDPSRGPPPSIPSPPQRRRHLPKQQRASAHTQRRATETVAAPSSSSPAPSAQLLLPTLPLHPLTVPAPRTRKRSLRASTLSPPPPAAAPSPPAPPFPPPSIRSARRGAAAGAAGPRHRAERLLPRRATTGAAARPPTKAGAVMVVGPRVGGCWRWKGGEGEGSGGGRAGCQPSRGAGGGRRSGWQPVGTRRGGVRPGAAAANGPGWRWLQQLHAWCRWSCWWGRGGGDERQCIGHVCDARCGASWAPRTTSGGSRLTHGRAAAAPARDRVVRSRYSGFVWLERTCAIPLLLLDLGVSTQAKGPTRQSLRRGGRRPSHHGGATRRPPPPPPEGNGHCAASAAVPREQGAAWGCGRVIPIGPGSSCGQLHRPCPAPTCGWPTQSNVGDHRDGRPGSPSVPPRNTNPRDGGQREGRGV